MSVVREREYQEACLDEEWIRGTRAIQAKSCVAMSMVGFNDNALS